MRSGNRREFLALAAAGASALALRGAGVCEVYAGEKKKYEHAKSGLYFDLLKQWTDKLCRLQVKEIKSDGILGGILCPECSRIHGRSADAVYPLLTMAHLTGENAYLDAAVMLQRWSTHVNWPDGSFHNEPTAGDWRGITVFSCIALAEALLKHGDLLDRKDRQAFERQLRAGCDFVFGAFNTHFGNINYPMTATACLALGHEVFGDEKYKLRATELARECMEFFTPHEKFIFGEGKPAEKKSPGGLAPVDIGYNVEESLGALAIYSTVMNDAEVLARTVESMRSHLELMAPDGAWDNSFSTRNYKWSYWGSRTSDGCQVAYSLLADRDPAFAKAVEMNTRLLAACTHDGILYGGPHYQHRGYLPCIHHTFCHAKAIAAVIDCGFVEKFSKIDAELPREKPYGLRTLTDLNTHLVSVGDWRATVSGYDWSYGDELNSGAGAINFLWHRKLGPVIAASNVAYSTKTEPANQQFSAEAFDIPMMPQLVCEIDGAFYKSANELQPKISASQDHGAVTFDVETRLLNAQLKAPKAGEIRAALKYVFTPGQIAIRVELKPAFALPEKTGSMPFAPGIPVARGKGEAKPEKGRTFSGVLFSLPLISRSDEKLSVDGSRLSVERSGARLQLASSTPLRFVLPEGQRAFNLIPGFEAVPVLIDLEPAKHVEVRLSAE